MSAYVAKHVTKVKRKTLLLVEAEVMRPGNNFLTSSVYNTLIYSDMNPTKAKPLSEGLGT